MTGLLECVPNFSEGRRPAVIDAIVGAALRVRGVALLDRTMDGDHNRCVLTLAGPADAIVASLLAAAGTAAKSIDLCHHEGVHPRVGALDVCPFVPLAGATMRDAVDAAERFAARLSRELQIPVFLYGEAARRPERHNLADVRKPGFEGLGALIESESSWKPDFGPDALHPTAGASVVGARDFLIAYNVVLDTDDMRVARRIARSVRERDGGLPAVKALGVAIENGRTAQVSMNLVDYRRTGIRDAFDAVAARARDHGVAVRESELIGLVPERALDAATARHVLLDGFDPKCCHLEARLRAPLRGAPVERAE